VLDAGEAAFEAVGRQKRATNAPAAIAE